MRKKSQVVSAILTGSMIAIFVIMSLNVRTVGTETFLLRLKRGRKDHEGP